MASNTIMNRYLEAEYADQDDEYYEPKVGTYHASTMGRCVRHNYFAFMEDIRPDDGAWPHFELGNTLEDVFVKALRNEYGWRYVKNSVPIRIGFDGYEIVGETDPVVLKDNMNIRRLYEVKTTKNLSYVKSTPKLEHVYQVHCYMYALGLLDDRCTIVYISKYDLDTQAHHVEFDKSIWNDIVDKVATLHEAIENEEPPEVQPKSEHDYFCDAGDQCCKNLLEEETDD